jgi:hypothetical protein
VRQSRQPSDYARTQFEIPGDIMTRTFAAATTMCRTFSAIIFAALLSACAVE